MLENGHDRKVYYHVLICYKLHMVQMACVGNCTCCKSTRFERCGAFFSHIWLQSIICRPRRKNCTSFITLGNDDLGAWDILTDSSFLGLPHTEMNAHLAQSVQIFPLIWGFRPFLWKMSKFCRHSFTLCVAFMVFKTTVSISRFQHRYRNTLSMDKKGRIAPVDSNFAYEAATMDSLGTVDRDDRWQDNWLENIEKSEECETVVKDCASNVITNDAGMRSGHDCVTDAMESEECEFTRRGMCKRHGVKGTRIELKSEVWKKRRYNYGYVTAKKIMYTCNIGKQNDIHTDGRKDCCPSE